MTLLILGLILWSVMHLVPVMAPGLRAQAVGAMGEGPWKGVFSVVTVAGLVLMVVGYQNAAYAQAWYPPAWGVHLNNLLMLIAVALFAASHSKGNAKRFVRHPMLLSVVVWAVAHLLVNGNVAALVLFGGLAVWAVVSIFATNARDGAWVKPAPAPARKDVLLLGITLVVYGLIAGVHAWLGYWPFGGGGGA